MTLPTEYGMIIENLRRWAKVLSIASGHFANEDLEAAAAAIEKLVAERDEWEIKWQRECMAKVASECNLGRAESRLKQAVEVIRPFAEIAEELQSQLADDHKNTMAWAVPEVGAFRRARQFLKESEHG